MCVNRCCKQNQRCFVMAGAADLQRPHELRKATEMCASIVVANKTRDALLGQGKTRKILASCGDSSTLATRKRCCTGLSASTIYRALHAREIKRYGEQTHRHRKGIPYKSTRARYYAIQPEHTIHELPYPDVLHCAHTDGRL